MRREPLESPDILDFRATVTVCVSALVLSVLRFQGRNMDVLMMLPEHMATEPWRLLTACLLHGGWIHLMFNLYWLYRFGAVLEPTFGLPKTIGIYFFLALFASAGQWAFSGGAIGLSGLVYGQFALVWVLHRYQPNYRPVMSEGTAGLFVIWFFLCILATELNLYPVANVAHGMGALAGLLLGLSLVETRFGRGRVRGALVLLSASLALAASVGRSHVNFSDHYVYQLNNEAIVALEADQNGLALEILERAVAIDDENITAWHNLGLARYRLGLDQGASEAFGRADQLRARAQEEATQEADRQLPFGL